MSTISPYKFVLEPEDDKRFLNRSEGGLLLNMWLTSDDGRFINRVGNVINSPILNKTSAKEDDKVVVQHHTFRNWIKQGGGINFGSMLDDGKYFCDADSVFAYEKDGEWFSTNGWLFLTPETYTHDTTLIVGDALRPDRGTVALPMDPKFETDYKVGDSVIIKFDMFIPVNIGDKAYYRIRPTDILMHEKRSHNNKTSTN